MNIFPMPKALLEGAVTLERWRAQLRKCGVSDDKITMAWAEAQEVAETTTIAPMEAYRAVFNCLLIEAMGS